MKTLAQRFSKHRASMEREDGFSLLEVTVSVPLMLIIFGLVFSTIGVTISLLGQVQTSGSSARAVSAVVEELNSAKTCAELNYLTSDVNLGSHNEEKFKVSVEPYSCGTGGAVELRVKADETGSNSTKYARSVVLAVR